MTDTPITPPTSAPVASTGESIATVAPVSSPKPYDDEVFNTYETEEVKTEEAAEPVKAEPEVEGEGEEEESLDAEGQTTDEGNKATKNDKVDDGFENVPVSRVINGKEVKFTVKDAILAYTKQEEFNRNMDRRITHVSQREKAWEKDQESFKGNLSKLMEVAQGGDFITTVRGLAKIATHGTDLDPTDIERRYFEQLDNVRKVWTEKTPAEREAYFAKRTALDAKARAAELEQEKRFNEERASLQERVQTLQQQHEIPNQEFWTNYETLTNELLQRGVIKSPDEIQAEHVVNYSLEIRRMAKVYEAAKATGLEDPDRIQEMIRVTALDPNLTVEDISKLIKNSGLVKIAPSEAVENLNRKAGKSNTQFSKASSTKKEDKTDGYAKEDLEYLYRNQPKGYSRLIVR